MAKQSITNVATRIVELLTPLESEERHRVVRGALALLGEGEIAPAPKPGSEGEGSDTELKAVSPRAQAWLKQNGLTSEILQQVFLIEGEKVELIAAEIPGKSRKEKTLNAYILEGVSQFLSSGDPCLDDKTARRLCTNRGFYDSANHAVFLTQKGNKMTGSKALGWKLTVPGLAAGAALIKEIAKIE
jgi:hypothetical protein